MAITIGREPDLSIAEHPARVVSAQRRAKRLSGFL
jgi:hypothetical protein